MVGIQEDHPQENGQDDQGPAVIVDVAVQPLEKGKAGPGQKVEPAEVQDPVQPQVGGFEVVDVLGAEVESIGGGHLVAGGDVLRQAGGGGEQIGGVLHEGGLQLGGVLGHGHGHKVQLI